MDKVQKNCGHYKAEEATVIWPYMSYARQETDKDYHAGHGGWGPTSRQTTKKVGG